MKRQFIYSLTLIILLFPILLYSNSPGKDFLITLNGSKLTGIIKGLSFSNGKSELYFENDLGDTYTVHPATIFGFAFEEEGETFFYESKFLGGKWSFLKIEKKGQELSLYTSSERQLQFTKANESPIVVEEKNPQMWLQFEGRQPFKVYRLNFRRLLRKEMERFPELAKRIGKKGFRYKNLPAIVDLYNKMAAQSRQKRLYK